MEPLAAPSWGASGCWLAPLARVRRVLKTTAGKAVNRELLSQRRDRVFEFSGCCGEPALRTTPKGGAERGIGESSRRAIQRLRPEPFLLAAPHLQSRSCPHPFGCGPCKLGSLPSFLRAGPYRFFFYSADRGEPPGPLGEEPRFRPGRAWSIRRLVEENAAFLLRLWDEYFGN